MKKTTYLTASVLAITFPHVSGFSQAPQHTEKSRPNILVFIADDAGMDFGCYGNKGIKTPNIDKLAADGLLVENAFLTASQCSPSRTSMLSGKFAHTIGTEDLHTGLPDTTKILPFYLQKKGYYTGLMLKGHIGKNGMKQFNWYDDGFWPDYIRDGVWFDKAVANFETFLDNSKNNPFFMWVGFVDPHRPYHNAEKIEQNRAPEVNSPDQVTVPPYLVNNESTRIDLAHYYDEITRMDRQIGEFMEVLEKRNLRENTLIVFLSDNGMPFPRAKGTAYDSGVKTPLIFVWDNQIKPGVRYKDELVSTIDLAPTLLDVAGLQIPADMYGKSIRNIFTDQTKKGREFVFSERNWHGTDEHIRTVRTKNYRFILNSYIHLPHGTPSDLSTSPSWYALKKLQHQNALTQPQAHIFKCPRPRVELYDLEKDPYELVNVADQQKYLDKAKELAKVLENWRDQTHDHPCWKRRKPDKVDRVSGIPFSGKKYDFIDD